MACLPSCKYRLIQVEDTGFLHIQLQPVGTANVSASCAFREQTCAVQIIGVTWAALDWAMQHNHGDEISSNSITALVQLLHQLLAAAPANLDLAEAFCLGVPILLRLLLGTAATYTDTEELVITVLDILHSAPEMDITTDDDKLAGEVLCISRQAPGDSITHKADRLWSALEKLLQAVGKPSTFSWVLLLLDVGFDAGEHDCLF